MSEILNENTKKDKKLSSKQKQVLLIILIAAVVLLLVGALTSIFVLKNKDEKDPGIFYYEDLGSGRIAITGLSTEYALSTEISIPERIVGKTVVVIAEKAFAHKVNLKKVTLPDSVIEIEKEAFINCSQLEEINFPTSLLKIGERAFEKSGLRSIRFAKEIKEIEDKAFANSPFLEVDLLFLEENWPLKWERNIFDGVKSIRWNYKITSNIKNILFQPTKAEYRYGEEVTADFKNVENFEMYDVFVNGNKNSPSTTSPFTIRLTMTENKDISFQMKGSVSDVDLCEYEKDDRGLVVTGIKESFLEQDPSLEGLSIKGEALFLGDRYGVYAIKEDAFKDLDSQIKYIEVSSSIEEIGARAFKGAKGVQNVSLSEGLKEIGEEAFSYIVNLKEIVCPSTLTKVGENFASYSQKVEKIDLSKADITELSGGEYFTLAMGLESLKTLLLPNKLKRINSSFLINCALEEISIPDNVESIDLVAFMDLYNLESLTLSSAYVPQELDISEIDDAPEGLTKIYSVFIHSCPNLKTITGNSNSGKYSIVKNALLVDEGKYLLHLGVENSIPESVEVIGIMAAAFNKTESIIIKKKTNLFMGAFAGFRGKTLDFSELNITKIPSFLLGLSEWGLTAEREQFLKSTVETVIIPQSVKVIGGEAFINCSNLLEVRTSESKQFWELDIEIIEEGAFAGCSRLGPITIPSSVSSIERTAFMDCHEIEVFFAEGSQLDYIGDYAFASCWSLQTISIPASVTRIGQFVFEDCRNLEEIEVESESVMYKSIDGVLLSKDEKELKAYPQKKNSSTYSIPSGVEIIERETFKNNVYLVSISIPSSVEYIHNNAFENCSNLETVIFIENNILHRIDRYAFYNCTNLSEINLPSSLSYVDEYAFANCINLSKNDLGYFSLPEKSDVVLRLNRNVFKGSGATVKTNRTREEAVDWIASWYDDSLEDWEEYVIWN